MTYRGDREQPPEDVVRDGLDDPVRHARPAKAAQRSDLGKALRCELVAQHSQRPDVAGDTHRGERRPQLDQPGPQLGRVDPKISRVRCPNHSELDEPRPQFGGIEAVDGPLRAG